MTSPRDPEVPFPVRPRVRHVKTLNGFDVNGLVGSLQPVAAAAPPPPISIPPAPPHREVLGDEVLDGDELIADRYRLEERLQQVPSSEIWSAFDLHLGREVVIRLFSDDAEGEAAAGRVRRQARTTIPPDAVASFRDEGEHEGRAFVVVDRALGETLASRIERQGRLSPADCAHIITSAADALDELHERGFTHGALDAGSIFFARGAAAEPTVVLLAPGVAPLVGAASGGAAARGVPARAPELQRAQAEPDARTDVYALAAVLYLALTGRPAFLGRSPSDARQRVLTASFATPTSLRPDLPSPLDAFFRRAFSVEPHRRFATARELAAVFRMAIDDRSRGAAEPAAPVPITRWDRVRSGVRFAGVAAVLATGAVVAIWALLEPGDAAEQQGLPAAASQR